MDTNDNVPRSEIEYPAESTTDLEPDERDAEQVTGGVIAIIKPIDSDS